ncbi:MAG TPA: peptidoglycan DD-metalloendopeptidase family protein [Gammaproteobacteria bacterium]
MLRSASVTRMGHSRLQCFIGLLIISVLPGCGSHIHHFVEPGETLYSISWAYGHDFREVAKWNEISPPYVIKKGQQLRVAPLPEVVAKKTENHRKHNQSANSASVNKETTSVADKQVIAPSSVQDTLKNNNILEWQWPTRGGKIMQTFDARSPGKQGVDVAGEIGQPVYAAAPGQVVYSGGGLSHYGKLIIVKHNETFLSAYAHNKQLLVKEGEMLKSGQLIAEMGSTGTNRTKLHFEIRRDGKAVDPLHYLPKTMQ